MQSTTEDEKQKGHLSLVICLGQQPLEQKHDRLIWLISLLSSLSSLFYSLVDAPLETT